MDNSTYIVGKDASLEKSIAWMLQQLNILGFKIEEHSWLNPLPHVWSVHIRDRDCPLLFTNGKGASKKAALASALGEFFERLATNYFWADYYLGETISNSPFVHYPQEKWFEIVDDTKWPEGLLTEELINFYDKERALQMSDLVDINSGNSKRGVCALPFVRESDQVKVYFPVNIIGNLYVSNGMSAGNTENEARVQALSEILERHIKFKIISEGISLPDVPKSVIDTFPTIKAGIAALQQKGFGVLVKDASLGGKYPVVNVTLLNSENQGCYASFGAHPRFDVALERSLTELLQGRELNTLNDFPAPVMDLQEVASAENLETHFIDSSGLLNWRFFNQKTDYEFTRCHFEGNTQQEFNWLVELFHATGKDIYIADYQHLGVYACRILVPTMSEIYACEDLVWENNNLASKFREDILNIEHLTTVSAAKLLNNIQDKDIDDLQPVAMLLGLPLQTDTLWQDFRVGELKALLAAISGDKHLLLQGCEWLSNFGHINQSRAKLYHCVKCLLEMDSSADDYNTVLEHLFTQAKLDQAKALIDGSVKGLNLENTLQGLLIKAYEKLQRVKSEKTGIEL